MGLSVEVVTDRSLTMWNSIWQHVMTTCASWVRSGKAIPGATGRTATSKLAQHVALFGSCTFRNGSFLIRAIARAAIEILGYEDASSTSTQSNHGWTSTMTSRTGVATAMVTGRRIATVTWRWNGLVQKCSSVDSSDPEPTAPLRRGFLLS